MNLDYCTFVDGAVVPSRDQRRVAPLLPNATEATLTFVTRRGVWQYISWQGAQITEIYESADLWTIREIVSYHQRPFRAYGA